MYSLPVTTAERGVVSAFWAFLSVLYSRHSEVRLFTVFTVLYLC